MLGTRDPSSGRPMLQRSAELAALAADDWCLTSSLQILGVSWAFQDEFDTARPLLDEAYAVAARLGYRRGLAVHWFNLGWAVFVRGRLDEARELLARGVAVSNEIRDPFPHYMADSLLTRAHVICGDTELAYALGSTTLQRAREAGVGFILGAANQTLGKAEMALGELAAARAHLETAVEVTRASQFVYFLTESLTMLGTLDRIEGKLEAARAHGVEALEVAQRLGSGWMQAGAERLLGRLSLTAGEAGDAERYMHDALGRLVAKGFVIDIPECLDVLGAVAAEQDSYEEAARLLGAAGAAREQVGVVRFPPEPEFWAGVERTTREALGDDGYSEAFTAGAALGIDEAVAYVRQTRGAARPT